MENVQILVIRLSHLVCPNLYSFISFAGIPCLLLFYILPSVFLAITLNIPKVLEILPIGKCKLLFEQSSSILFFRETIGAEWGIPEIFHDLHSLPSITLNHPHPNHHPHWDQLQDCP